MNNRQLLLGALLVLSAQAGASTTYVYTGRPYTNILNDNQLFGAPAPGDFILGTYDTSMSVTGRVELENTLGANLEDVGVLLTTLSYSFFDGRNTIDSNSNHTASIAFTTDAQGEITGWGFSLVVGDPSLETGGRNIINSNGNVGGNGIDVGEIDTSVHPNGRTTDFGQSFVPGVWSIQTTPVPVPPSLWLLGPTIVGLGLARRRTA